MVLCCVVLCMVLLCVVYGVLICCVVYGVVICCVVYGESKGNIVLIPVTIHLSGMAVQGAVMTV